MSLTDVHKVYARGEAGVHALRGLSLGIERGAYVSIMGPSGSGKSTLLNLLGCLDRPTSGQLCIGDQDVGELNDDELSELRGRFIGFVFQSFNLIPQLTVLENIQMPLYYTTGHEDRERCEELAERVGLADRLHHRPAELSGGQQQRVALARALVNQPPVMLADEPTGNLDSKTGADVLNLIDHLNADGMTVIMVTHDPEVGRRSQRTIHLRDGLIEREHQHR